MKAEAIGITIIMRLPLGEQGIIGDNVTSCEEIGKERGKERVNRGRKRNQNMLLCETPFQESSVKFVKDALPLPRFPIYLKTDTFESDF